MYPRRGLPLTPGKSRRRPFGRPDDTRNRAASYLCLLVLLVCLGGAAVQNVRFFSRHVLQRDALSHTSTEQQLQTGGIGINRKAFETLPDGGEWVQEEHAATVVSKLIGSEEERSILMLKGGATEDKLLGGVRQREGATSLGSDLEDEPEPLDEDEISVHKVDGLAFDVADEEARRGLGEVDADKDDVELKLLTNEKEVVKKEMQKSKKKNGHASCDPHFLSSEEALVEPGADARDFEKFQLRYRNVKDEEKLIGRAAADRFNGHQTWEERGESFKIKDPMTVHCGFLSGKQAGLPGLNLDTQDLEALSSCHIAVVSATFGASDTIHSISKSQVSDLSHRTVCFVLFLDDASLAAIKKDKKPGVSKDGRVGIWRPVVVRPPMPYEDPRRTGKIPKLLAHRLFPKARHSIWIDAKLKLAQDPRAVLERFLWRAGAEYAISNHYDRHDVEEEVVQNKKLKKYDHAAIDEQFATYVREGLTGFNASDPQNSLPSYVPEGSFIVREHTPMSNLFSCLWFNEVDRFTSRDQLSFAHTFLRLTRANPNRRFALNMFRDCERRATAKLFRHRSEGSTTRQRRTAIL